MAEVAFHPEARDEYDAALVRYQVRSPRAAVRFEAEVERLLGLIEANPDSFPAYDDDHRFAVLRRFPFSVVYQVQPDCGVLERSCLTTSQEWYSRFPR